MDCRTMQNQYCTIEIEIIHVSNGKSLGSQFHPDMATNNYLSSFTTIEKCISCSHLQSPPSAPISKLIKKSFQKKHQSNFFFNLRIGQYIFHQICTRSAFYVFRIGIKLGTNLSANGKIYLMMAMSFKSNDSQDLGTLKSSRSACGMSNSMHRWLKSVKKSKKGSSTRHMLQMPKSFVSILFLFPIFSITRSSPSFGFENLKSYTYYVSKKISNYFFQPYSAHCVELQFQFELSFDYRPNSFGQSLF